MTQSDIRKFVKDELEWIGVMEHPVILEADVFRICVKLVQKLGQLQLPKANFQKEPDKCQ